MAFFQSFYSVIYVSTTWNYFRDLFGVTCVSDVNILVDFHFKQNSSFIQLSVLELVNKLSQIDTVWIQFGWILNTLQDFHLWKAIRFYSRPKLPGMWHCSEVSGQGEKIWCLTVPWVNPGKHLCAWWTRCVYQDPDNCYYLTLGYWRVTVGSFLGDLEAPYPRTGKTCGQGKLFSHMLHGHCREL